MPGLPSHIPKGVEFKKLAFAAYNAGASTVIKAAKEFVAGGSQEYNWTDLAGTNAVKHGPGQPVDYVAKICERLGA